MLTGGLSYTVSVQRAALHWMQERLKGLVGMASIFPEVAGRALTVAGVGDTELTWAWVGGSH